MSDFVTESLYRPMSESSRFKLLYCIRCSTEVIKEKRELNDFIFLLIGEENKCIVITNKCIIIKVVCLFVQGGLGTWEGVNVNVFMH